jgi:deoxyribodipyrimidine photolyase-related protein
VADGARPIEASAATERPSRGRDRVTVVLPWDLDPRLSAFPRTPDEGQLLVLETRAKPRALPFHRKKLVLVVSALRHLVLERRAAGFHVEHRVADDWTTGVREFARWARPAALHAVEPREWGPDRRFRALSSELPLTLHPDGGDGGHFLLRRREFLDWAEEQGALSGKSVRMDRFYPTMRRRLGLLVDRSGRPAGGKWSFDAENRKPARGVAPPTVLRFPPDDTTRRVMRWVGRPEVGRWGTLEGFDWPVTRADALAALQDFLAGRLESFGPYEDAIRHDTRQLFHSLLSSSLNLGLLHPLEVAQGVAEAHARGRVSLASAEGMIRQVIGWREFIRGVYWLLMPGLREANQLGATLPLPRFFWEPERTEMQCLRDALTAVRDDGWTHHIARLMVICNWATMAGVDPRPVSHWFWAAFVDAYEWVELPNVVGMGMHGTSAFTTKPYVASAAYIKRMSGLPAKGRGRPAPGTTPESPCTSCRYDPDRRTGPDACPYNALYWDFLARHRARLDDNPRMRTLYRTWERWSPAERKAIQSTADAHRASLEPSPRYEIDEDGG